MLFIKYKIYAKNIENFSNKTHINLLKQDNEKYINNVKRNINNNLINKILLIKNNKEKYKFDIK